MNKLNIEDLNLKLTIQNTQSNNHCNDVSAVIVTFHPNFKILETTIEAISKQVSDIFIVDNSSSRYDYNWLDKYVNRVSLKIHLCQQKENIGIGAAHNIGIMLAIKQGAKYVLLLDQDSQAEPNMVVKMRSACTLLIEKNIQVAAIGPQYHNSESITLSSFAKVGCFRFLYCNCEGDSTIVDADFLISSGSLFPVEALKTVGLMDENLFIDHVDTEWFFRAKSKGLKVFGLCGAVMTHALGEQRIEVRLWRKLNIPIHKPFRYYYMFRNSLLLYRRGYMPLGWKFADFFKCLKMVVFFIAFVKYRFEVLKMMRLGVIDGVRGKVGKRNNL